MLAKALRPPPEKWHGIEDVEIRYRQRYLDLMANEDVRDIFRTRAAVVAAMRRYLDDRGFMEVETPVLQPEAGGAAATPFVTHHRALDQDFFLRISLELHLKRLIIGGYDRVYEIGRIFRNEGVSWKYNPEFTMLECYEAYADYNDVARMVEEMVSGIAHATCSARRPCSSSEHAIDLDAAVAARHHARRADRARRHRLRRSSARARRCYDELKRRGFGDLDPGWSWGKLLDEAVSHYVEPKLIQPTFLLDYPKEISPLAKSKPGEDGIVERFEVFIAGFEMGNAYSRAERPDRPARALRDAARASPPPASRRSRRSTRTSSTALEHGMPPTGGLGIGIDRLAMILTGQHSIREVILFPALRRKE